MTKYPMTINLSQELVEKLRKEKENNPKFRPSHLIEDLLKEYYNEIDHYKDLQFNEELDRQKDELAQYRKKDEDLQFKSIKYMLFSKYADKQKELKT